MVSGIAKDIRCGLDYDSLNDLEKRVTYKLGGNGYGIITESISDENFTTFCMKPTVNLVPCEDCLNDMRSH